MKVVMNLLVVVEPWQMAEWEEETGGQRHHRETALTSIVDCLRKRSSIAAVTSVVPRFILLRTRPARWASIRTRIRTLIMYKDGRFARHLHLQSRREYDRERLRRHLKRRNEIGVLEPW